MKLLALILGVSGALGLSLKHESSSTAMVFNYCDSNHDQHIDGGSELECAFNLAGQYGIHLSDSKKNEIRGQIPPGGADYNQLDAILNSMGV